MELVSPSESSESEQELHRLQNVLEDQMEAYKRADQTAVEVYGRFRALGVGKPAFENPILKEEISQGTD